jgi:Acetyltransferase (GNAT) family
MAASYAVRPLAPREAAAGARAWNDLADGTLPAETVARIETILRDAGTHDFVAFVAETEGEMCGIVTARVVRDPLAGNRGEIEALMIDSRLPEEAGEVLAQRVIDWLRERDVESVSHTRDAAAPGGAFWERLGFRPDKLRYTLRG